MNAKIPEIPITIGLCPGMSFVNTYQRTTSGSPLFHGKKCHKSRERESERERERDRSLSDLAPSILGKWRRTQIAACEDQTTF